MTENIDHPGIEAVIEPKIKEEAPDISEIESQNSFFKAENVNFKEEVIHPPECISTAKYEPQGFCESDDNFNSHKVDEEIKYVCKALKEDIELKSVSEYDDSFSGTNELKDGDEHDKLEAVHNDVNPHNASDGRRFLCKLCSKRFRRKDHREIHMAIHTGQRFQCDICNKSFSQKGKLNTHKRIHTGNLPFQCEVCYKYFALKSLLASHNLIHHRIRPFECKVCNKTFVTKIQLNSHKLVHVTTSSLPFKCEVCNTFFSQKYSLSCHMVVHTKVHAFQCEICNKSFTQKTHLNSHKLSHMTNHPFQCEL